MRSDGSHAVTYSVPTGSDGPPWLTWSYHSRCYGSCDGILSTICNFNHVFVGYCDGSSFSGQREGPHNGLMYRGRANLDAVCMSKVLSNDCQFVSNQSIVARAHVPRQVIDSLLVAGLCDATDVILTGGSAGGLTAYLQADHVASRLAAAGFPPTARFKALGDAGFFLDHLAWDGRDVSRAEFTYAFHMWNSSTGVDSLEW
jgi:hypothetical protein